MVLDGIRTHIRIGAFEVMRCAELELGGLRRMPLSHCSVLLNDAGGRMFAAVADGDAVTIRLGYRSETPAEWTGTVVRKEGRGDQTLVCATGSCRALTEMTICESFIDETPEAVVRWAIRQAGLPVGRIDSPGVVFPRFTASGIPLWQVARQCEHTCRKAFGLDMSGWDLWVGSDGRVNWGDFEEEGDVPVIATGAGLISHRPVGGLSARRVNIVETFLMPEFWHSRKFRLVDIRRGIDSTFRATGIKHFVTGSCARTLISYGGACEKF